MKKLLFLLFLSVFTKGFSQTDTIRIGDKIAGYELYKSDLMSRGRRMLLNEFKAGNMDKVKNIMNYFDKEVNDDDHMALWPMERLLLYYWTEDYDKVIDYSLYNVGDSAARHDPVVYPKDDALYNELVSKSNEDFDYLLENAVKYGFSKDAQDFLPLFLEYLLTDGKHYTLEGVSKKAETFITEYPYSPLTGMVKKYISYKIVPADFIFGLYFGGGYANASGNLTDYFDPKGAFCVSMDFYYKKMAFSVMVNAGMGKLQKNISFDENNVWQAGDRMELTSVGFGLGYTIFDNNAVRITPLAGMSIGYVMPSDSNSEENKKYKVGYAFSGMIGLNATWRFYKSNLYKHPPGSANSSLGVNVCIVYVPSILNKEGPMYNGNTIFLTIGLNLDLFLSKRVY